MKCPKCREAVQIGCDPNYCSFCGYYLKTTEVNLPPITNKVDAIKVTRDLFKSDGTIPSLKTLKVLIEEIMKQGVRSWDDNHTCFIDSNGDPWKK